ncbi:sodium channel and clathrin linker 1 isoform 1-T2 [Clarias gariepinus]|uniref:sodium channel and clathrin linker 1 n=1 Tax=Clarias gariepinus TaxID=13013 RepID=UPI00234C060F|nr:sodium channel and clathrin linker 1 [Clarias gariepinus]XP_053336183.1 sodium channel and clathrin linker 1 [Clarias gariepinus]
MESELEFLRDQVNRLNLALGRYQGSSSAFTQAEDVESEPAALTRGPSTTDQSLMAPLIVEYDRHMQLMEKQLQHYQRQMVDVKASLEQVVRENERLYAGQRLSVEKQLQSLSVDEDAAADAVAVRNLEEQLKCAVEEKERAVQLWRVSTQELDRLQKLHQSSMRDEHAHTAQHQHTQNQLAQLQQHAQKLQATNQNLESTNQQLVRSVTEQSVELQEVHTQLRQAKQDLRTATAKVDEMTKLMKDVQDQMHRTEEDAAEAHGREEASDRRLQQLQTALNQIEGRLKAASQEAESVRRKEAAWEKQVGELQGRCATLEDERFEALQRLRDSLQLAEEAALQRDQAQLREKQRVEELERMKDGMKQLVEEAAIRTRKEVECVRQQCNTQIQRLTEELAALQLECSDKQSQLERAHRERKAVEEELEKVYREGRYGDADLRKMEALHQRSLNAERVKDELEHTLNTTHSNMKKMELQLNEELQRCQEEVRRLQVALSSVRSECSSVCEERLSLQQENQQLHRDMDTLRKECVSAQRHAKLQVSRMQQEVCEREQAVESRLREMEQNNKHSTDELQRRLLAQQQNNKRYREESLQRTHTLQHTLTSVSVELSRQKQRCQELEKHLQLAQEKILDCERELAEQQEKNTRLQTRLTQAEHRAFSASQQLTLMSQRRKAGSLVDLDLLE